MKFILSHDFKDFCLLLTIFSAFCYIFAATSFCFYCCCFLLHVCCCWTLLLARCFYCCCNYLNACFCCCYYCSLAAAAASHSLYCLLHDTLICKHNPTKSQQKEGKRKSDAISNYLLYCAYSKSPARHFLWMNLMNWNGLRMLIKMHTA